MLLLKEKNKYMNKTEILHEITTYKLIQLYNKTIKNTF